MFNFFTIFVLIIGVALVLRGSYIFLIHRHEVKSIYGFGFTKAVLGNTLVALLLTGLLFFAIFLLNLSQGCLYVDSVNPLDKVASRFPDPLAVSLYEEFIFRALMFSSLVTLTPDRRVLLGVSSLIFCLAHFPSDIATFVSYFVGGLVYGYAFLKFQSLWVPVGIHFAWNFFQGQVFGFPVSGIPSYGLLSTSIAPDAYLNGGEIGPEGSMVGVLARLIILSWLFLSPAKQENDSFLIFKRKP